MSIFKPIVRLLRIPISQLRLWCAIDRLNRNNDSFIDYDVKIVNVKNLFIGKNVQVQSGSYLHCGGLDWSDKKGFIQIGDNTFIGPHCVFFGAGGIRIGANTLISPAVKIVSHEHSFLPNELICRQPSQFKEVRIHDNVYIGTNATLLPGVTIGEGSVIGAGAVVTKDVPAYSVATGIPAKVVRNLKVDV